MSEHHNIAGAIIQINNAKFYVPVVILSINDNVTFLENIKQRFKRTISWNKDRSEITTQPKNNLNHLIDLTFRLFVLSFKNGDNGPTRDYFDKYYMPLLEIKYFNALINKKNISKPVSKNRKEAYEKHIEMSRNDGYATGNLLDFLYHQNYFKLIGLSKQTNTNIPQQINFTGKLEEDDSTKMFFIAEKQQKAILNFCSDSLITTA